MPYRNSDSPSAASKSTDRSESWSHFGHGADIGLEGRGSSLAASFEQAALALTAVITDPRRVEGRKR